MGYRSQVHCVIYGTDDQIAPLVAKHRLLGKGVFEMFEENIKQFAMTKRIYDGDATLAQEPNEQGARPILYKDVTFDVIELSNDGEHSWKWYTDYPDVQAWHAFMDEAREVGCCVEFVRIGEEANDIDVEQHFPADWGGDPVLSVSSRIHMDFG
jgi:hypothetical protein